MKKYEITDICNPKDGILFRVRALVDFGDIKAGEIGGYIENEGNLSQKGTRQLQFKC